MRRGLDLQLRDGDVDLVRGDLVRSEAETKAHRSGFLRGVRTGINNQVLART
jgi:hypothetical protein